MEQIITSFTLGLVAAGSPCVIPLYPGFLAYLAAQSSAGIKVKREYLGFFVLAGVLVMMLILGALIAFLSISIGNAMKYLIPVVDLVIIFLGVLLLFNVNPFKKIPSIRSPVLKNPFVNAFIYGMLYAPISLPCSGALLISIFAISLSNQEVLSRLSTFLWFGLGFGAPLLVLSLMAGAVQKSLTGFFVRYNRWINTGAGLLLIGIGLYDLNLNKDLLGLAW